MFPFTGSHRLVPIHWFSCVPFTISTHPVAHAIVICTFQVVASVEGAKRDSGLLQYHRLAHCQKVSEQRIRSYASSKDHYTHTHTHTHTHHHRYPTNAVEDEVRLRRDIDEEVLEVKEEWEEGREERVARYKEQLAEWKTYMKARVGDVIMMS